MYTFWIITHWKEHNLQREKGFYPSAYQDVHQPSTVLLGKSHSCSLGLHILPFADVRVLLLAAQLATTV